MDVVSSAGAVAAALKVSRELIEMFLARRGPFRRLQRLVRTDLNQNGDLSPEQRDAAIEVLMELHVDPECVGAIYRYVELGETVALDAFEARIAELIESPEARQALVHSTENRLSEVVPEERKFAFESRVTRSVLARAIEDQGARFEGKLEDITNALLEAQETTAGTTVLLLDWAPERRRKELAELGESHGELVERLDEVMQPLAEAERPQAARRLIESPPDWLDEAPPILWGVVARFVEAGGYWELSADAWEDVAERYRQAGDIDKEHDAMLNAAVSAQLANDEERRGELLALVRSERPDHPRLLLERANELQSGAERLELLAALDPDNDDIRALLACHRVLAHLMEEELSAAKSELELAIAVDENRVQVRMLAINVAVEEGRQAVRENLPTPTDALKAARDSADEVRSKLLGEGRPDEAMRCLMLATDATFLTDGATEAGQLLVSVSAEELETPDAPGVLGEVALRVQAPLVALAVTHNATARVDIRRIRASAETRLEGTGGKFVEEACATLDELVAEEGVEGEMAAIMRLLACLHQPDVPWNDDAAERLQRPHLKEAALGVKAIMHARRDGLATADAITDAASFSSARVKRECRFQCALEAEETEEAARRARELLEVGTDQANRQLCAIALHQSGDSDRAKAEARSLLDDAATPRFVRREMHDLLTEIALEADSLEEAASEVAAWLTDFPGDNRGNWLRTRVAARKRSANS